MDNGLSSVVRLPFSFSLITNIQDEYIKPLISYVPESKKKIPGFLWLRMMLRESITDDCFVDENRVFTEDVVFDLFFARHIDRIAVVQRPLYNYCQRSESLTRKYRPNMWNMYKNLYGMCLQYCEANQISNVSYNLSTLLLDGALHSIQQAAAYLKYADFKKEYQSIRCDKMMNGIIDSIALLSSKFRLLTINQKLIYFMLRFIHVRIVYHFYRWRQLR